MVRIHEWTERIDYNIPTRERIKWLPNAPFFCEIILFSFTIRRRVAITRVHLYRRIFFFRSRIFFFLFYYSHFSATQPLTSRMSRPREIFNSRRTADQIEGGLIVRVKCFCPNLSRRWKKRREVVIFVKCSA